MPVRLRPAVLDDAEALAALARSQRAHLGPWEPERPTHWFTEVGQREALEQAEHDRAADRSYAHLITDAAGSILGRLTLASVVRGAGQFCSIGYWVAREATGRGVATAAVGQALHRSPSPSSACTACRPSSSPTTTPPAACWNTTGSSGTAWLRSTCGSPAAGRTTSSGSSSRRRRGSGDP